jgi:NAD(P)-dependent dehydrogenase (short-subunit alcohol dehydrogenase family)
MENIIKIQRIFITGTNRGLGLALTREFLLKKKVVFAQYRTISSELQKMKNSYQNSLFLFGGDLTHEKAIREIALKILRGDEAIDLLINNAAVHLEHEAPPIEQVDFSVYLPSFLVNSVVPLMVVKHMLPLLRKGRGKRIVNISSEAGSITDSWRKSEYSYCMSKAALNMAGTILKNALSPEGFIVLQIHPGWFSSDMGGSEAPITPEDAAKRLVPTILDPKRNHSPQFIDLDGNPMRW